MQVVHLYKGSFTSPQRNPLKRFKDITLQLPSNTEFPLALLPDNSFKNVLCSPRDLPTYLINELNNG